MMEYPSHCLGVCYDSRCFTHNEKLITLFPHMAQILVRISSDIICNVIVQKQLRVM